MFNNFKSKLMLVAFTLGCGYIYGYDLIVISDSKDYSIKFWKDKDVYEIDPGSAHAFMSVEPKEKLYYNRGGETFAFGSVEIERKFGDLSLDNLDKKNLVIIRFDEKTGYLVAILQQDSTNANSAKGKTFECKHKKVAGIVRYSTEVKPFGQEFVFNYTDKSLRSIFNAISAKLISINNDMTSITKKTVSGQNGIKAKIAKIKTTIGDINKVGFLANIGGEIKFYRLKEWLDKREKRLKKSDKI